MSATSERPRRWLDTLGRGNHPRELRVGVRPRLVLWLALVIVPIIAGGWLAVHLIDDQLSQRIEADLTNIRRIEAARIMDALGGYERDAISLAAGRHVQTFVAQLSEVRAGEAPGDLVIGGQDGFAVVNPNARRPLNELATQLDRKARTTGGEVAELRLVDTEESILGETDGFGWRPYDPTIVARAVETKRPVFGNAFVAEGGGQRLGMVAPILNGDEVVGALILETYLGPIVDLVVQHESVGRTSEAHIAQPTPNGDAEFVTRLRFERDAAFSKVVSKDEGLPINQSLTSPGGTVVNAPDYRQVESVLAIETLSPTGWGLVVKVDAAEAFEPVAAVKQVVVFAAALSAILIFVGWLVLVRPLGHRLRRTAQAAERVASGNYKSLIADHTGDEIGDMARAIDRLATDLDADIEIRSIAEERLRRQANHDALTGLYNRKHAADAIRRILALAPSSVLFLDLDGFKVVNDTHGHAVGDEVLIVIGERLRTAIPEPAVVARWGGDEFVVILPECTAAGAAKMAERVRGLLEEPVVTSTGLQRMTCSIGTATCTGSSTIDELLFEADAAMFAQKQARGALRSVPSATRHAVSSALDGGRLEVWYQPIVSLEGVEAQPRMIGCEALVRLRESGGRVVSPAEFLPEIESTSLGLELDRRVVAIATRDLARWRATDDVGSGFMLALNLGGASIGDVRVPKEIADRARSLGVEPATLLIEIPEAVEDLDDAVVEAFRESGAGLALDDFGSQYSNLDRLVDIRPRIAKLDRSLVARLGDSNPAGADVVVSKISDMCAGLGVDVVAEGVETPFQIEALQALGVTVYQGFYFATPQPSRIFEGAWMTARAPVGSARTEPSGLMRSD